MRQATVSVVEGPDRGRSFKIDQPQVSIGTGARCAIRLSDTTISKHHLDIQATDDGYRVRDLGSTNGTSVAGIRVTDVVIDTPVNLNVGSTVLLFRPGDEEVEIPLSHRRSFGDMLGESVKIRHVFAILERVAPTGSTVLLEGESGTGKEVAATAIHQHSGRADAPLVIVDCGAIPATLIESELFGHERGAFTGADQARAGAFEEAAGGTVFLDEVGELSLELQPKLLRFLESRQIKRVGSARHHKVDVRVIAATNRPLATAVTEGRFREDLLYRLSVVRVELPPLRDRPDDITLLAHHFAQQLGADSATLVTPEIESMLASYL